VDEDSFCIDHSSNDWFQQVLFATQPIPSGEFLNTTRSRLILIQANTGLGNLKLVSIVPVIKRQL